MSYLIGIDIGTSGTKTVLYDLEGNAVAQAMQEYPMHPPQAGWAEENPEDWWNAAVTTVVRGVQPCGCCGIRRRTGWCWWRSWRCRQALSF